MSSISLGLTIIVSCDKAVRGHNQIKTATKKQIAFYGSTPAYKTVLDLHGWGAVQGELNLMSKQGRWDEMGELITDEILGQFAVVRRRLEPAGYVHVRGELWRAEVPAGLLKAVFTGKRTGLLYQHDLQGAEGEEHRWTIPRPMGTLVVTNSTAREVTLREAEREIATLAPQGRATLDDLHGDLGLSTAAAAVQVAHADWGAKLAEALRGAEEAGHAAMDMPLKPLLATEESGQIVRLATGDEPGDDEGEDENDEPRDYKNRLLAILGLAWLVGR